MDPRPLISAWLPHAGLLAATALGTALAWTMVAPVAKPLAVALAVVLLTHALLYAPLTRLIGRALPPAMAEAAPPLAAGLSVAALLAGAVGLALLILWSTLGGLSLTAGALLDLASQDPARVQRVADTLTRRADDLLRLYPTLPWSRADLHQAIASAVSHLALGPQVLSYLATGTGSLVVELAFAALAAAGLYLHGSRLAGLALRALPVADSDRAALMDRHLARTHDLVLGTLGRSLALGACHGLSAWLIGGFPPVLVAVVAAFAVLLPLVGSAFVWLPLASLLAGQGNWPAAIALALVQQLSAWAMAWLARGQASTQVLTPLGFLLVLYLVGGILATGVRGLVLAPAAALITMTLSDILKTTYRRHG